MRIKHWAGYGCVNATKVKDSTCTLHVKVEGEHEHGLDRDNLYDLYKWLVQIFDKSLKDVSEINWERNTKRMTRYGYEDYEPPRYEIEEVSWKQVHYKFWY